MQLFVCEMQLFVCEMQLFVCEMQLNKYKVVICIYYAKIQPYKK